MADLLCSNAGDRRCVATAPAAVAPPRSIARRDGRRQRPVGPRRSSALCAAFIDQGFAGWPLPHRDLGLFRAFSSLYANDAGPATHWLRDLAEEIIRIENCDLEPLESIRESCTMLGIDESEWDDFIAATLLALRGWAGMLWQMEVRPDRVPFPVPAGSLVEYLAVRLILERLALTHITRHALGYRGLLIDLRRSLEPQAVSESGTSAEQRAFVVFQLAQRLGWSPRVLAQLSQGEWAALVAEIESFSELDRRRILHLAFERRFHAVRSMRFPRMRSAKRLG